MVDGGLVEVPTLPDGSIDSDVLRRLADIPADRPLVLKRPDGSNQLINSGQHVRVRPQESFLQAPDHRRGLQPAKPRGMSTSGAREFRLAGGRIPPTPGCVHRAAIHGVIANTFARHCCPN